MVMAAGGRGRGGTKWRRKKPTAWDTTKSEYFLKWDAIKGEQIPKESLEFFIHVKGKLDHPFDDPDDKALFITNVFSQTKGEEVSLIRNSLASQIVEQLIPDVTDEILLEFATAVYQQFTELSQDQFASHVLQTLLLSMTCRIQAGQSLVHSALQTWVLDCSDQLFSELPSLCRHQYASHVVRSCLECLSGCRAPRLLTRSRRSQQQRWRDQQAEPVVLDKASTPEEFREEFVQMVKAVKNADDLAEGLSCPDQNFSAVIQVILHILHTLPMPKLSRKFIRRLSKLRFGGCPPCDPASLPSVFATESQLRVLEAALASCEEAEFARLHRKYYAGRLARLMADNVTAISVQRMVEACSSADVLETVLEELVTEASSAWWTSSRLPTALAQACIRLHSHQGRLMKLAARLCDCEAAERSPQLALCLLYRRSWSELSSIQGRLAQVEISMDGSLLLQALLKFAKPTRLISSLLSLRADQLSAIVQSRFGSHVVDALVTSSHLGDKGKTRLLESLKDELVPLACSKHGSRALDALWASASPSHRAFIAEALAPHQQQLREDFFGGFAVRNFALQLFVKKRADWTAYVKREANKRKMFADLLPTTPGSGKSPAPAAVRRGTDGGSSGGGGGSAPKRPRPRDDRLSDSLFVIDRTGVQGVLDDLE